MNGFVPVSLRPATQPLASVRNAGHPPALFRNVGKAEELMPISPLIRARWVLHPAKLELSKVAVWVTRNLGKRTIVLWTAPRSMPEQ